MTKIGPNSTNTRPSDVPKKATKTQPFSSNNQGTPSNFRNANPLTKIGPNSTKTQPFSSNNQGTPSNFRNANPLTKIGPSSTNTRPFSSNNQGTPSNFKSPSSLNKGGGRSKFRNLLRERREQALRDFLYERRVRRGLATRKRKKKRTLPIIPPKSLFILLKSKNKVLYDRKFVDYKNRSLLQEYISFDGKILPRRKTGITTKQQRYLTKAIKTARILCLLPFVKKEKGFLR
uniref:ribosomal protein S18 n=1 Tax=Gormaniella terricola TaxID=2904618 RepID=UPI0021CC9435|nr:ribosomal protein S18 [Gormaniella terricola]UWV18255.1 ribosomal protein S18 [Gormaniella terricola]